MNNLGDVVKFEVVRSLKKPSFWIAAILLPVLLVGYLFISGLMGMGINDAIEGGSDTTDMILGLADEAGLIEDTKGFELFESEEEGLAALRGGELDVFYFIPADFAESPVVRLYEVVSTGSLMTNYEGPIREALVVSAAGRVDPSDLLILTSSFRVDTVRYNSDGEIDNILGRMVAPIIALGVFYILICLFGNRLMLALVEEKENRISEMILTTVSSKALVMGKIISMIVIGLIQIAILIIPMIIAYFVMNNKSSMLPEGFVIPAIIWDPWMIMGAVVLLFVGYFLFVALCMVIGVLVPTAKDAGSYGGVIIIMVILPVFFLASFLSDTPDTMTYVLTYFPFSAPIALMLRNAMGTLPIWEYFLGLAVMLVSSVGLFYLVVNMFKYSAMEYNAKLSPLALFKRRK